MLEKLFKEGRILSGQQVGPDVWKNKTHLTDSERFPMSGKGVLGRGMGKTVGIDEDVNK